MIVGTCYFPTRRHAEKYYQYQRRGDAHAAADYYRARHGESTLMAVIERKLAAGEIHIGKPPRKPGDKLVLIDNGLRYAIEEREAK